MYYILEHIYKIGNTLEGNPSFFALFSVSGNPDSISTFEDNSAENLAKRIREHVDSRNMSRNHVEATFDNTRKYSDRGGTIKYQSPFSPDEEKVFLQVLMEPRS